MAMTINKVIKELMKAEGMSQMTMALAIGKKKPNDVSARLNNDNMTFDRAIEMLSALGYEVVVQKRKRGKRTEGQILVEMSSKDEEEQK